MRRAAQLGLVAVLSAIAALATAPMAAAEITGPCDASINSQNVRTYDTGARSTPIPVQEHTRVPVTMSSAQEISHLSVSLEFGGFSWDVHNEPTSGTSWEKSVNVDKYAEYGVGLYKVSGHSATAGGGCTGSALVEVEGNPLSTAAGIGGAAALVVGAVGLAGAGIAGAREARLAYSSSMADTDDWMSDTYHQVRRLCVGFVIAAFMLTLVAVAGAALTAAAPGPGRVRFRPRLSFFGILGGLLAGLGAGVLLQQYAILYPTRTVAIIELAAGLALGILLPSLGRLRAVRRINRRLAQA